MIKQVIMIFEGLARERQLIRGMAFPASSKRGDLKSSGIERYPSGRGLHQLIARVQMDTDAG